MNSDQPSPESGRTSVRKPAVAANLSFLFAGLGQVYCGCLRRGITHMCAIVGLLTVAILSLSTQFGDAGLVLLGLGSVALLFTLYSAWDARLQALRTRPDYRLKDYNTVSVYLSLAFLFLGVAVGFAVAVRENYIQVFTMVGTSMSPTIEEGSRVFVRRDAYRRKDPERNDLVAFRNPANRAQTWVKRVIGLPGDTVELKQGAVYLNGKPLEEPGGLGDDRSDAAPLIVPEHHCFVLGDNWANSRDSRHFGPVPMIALVGKVAFAR